MWKFWLNPRFVLVAITGGPSGGKTTLMARAKQYGESWGYRVVIRKEIPTELITSGFSPFTPTNDPLTFQKFQLMHMLFSEELYARMLADEKHEKPILILCDRGPPDTKPYIGVEQYNVLVRRIGLSPQELMDRYKIAIHMVTAADGAEPSYTLENNAARSETPEQARVLDKKTRDAWVGHQHLRIVDNSTGFDEKVRRALTALARKLHMPVPKEKERKFLFKNWDKYRLQVLENSTSLRIVQTYLAYGTSGAERRVRERYLDGSSTYYYTEKWDTDEPGVRREVEDIISHDRYEKLLREQDPATTKVVKTRHSMHHAGHILEIDVYHEPIGDLVVVEVEVDDMNERVEFPPGWDLEEVTLVKKYKNRQIAEDSIARFRIH